MMNKNTEVVTDEKYKGEPVKREVTETEEVLFFRWRSIEQVTCSFPTYKVVEHFYTTTFCKGSHITKLEVVNIVEQISKSLLLILDACFKFLKIKLQLSVEINQVAIRNSQSVSSFR